jgi:DNA-binding GntR family transcriptional regulator
MEITANKINNRQSLAVKAYEKIVRKIISLEYNPGQHLEENQLVERLGIGRTPIREALLRLAGENMVESQPNKGFVVRPITLQNTKAVFEGMKILELGVASLAVRQDATNLRSKMEASNEKVKSAVKSMDVFGLVEANHDFHMYFADCSHNEYLVRAVNEVRSEAKRLSYLSYANEIDPERSIQIHYESVIREHDEIMTYLGEKNEARLKETIEKHIRTFQQRIILYMTS